MTGQPCAGCNSNKGGPRSMCDSCLEEYGSYRAPQSGAEAHGIGIIGPDGKHIAIQDFFDTEKLA